ncbi:sensor histidine kinase [Streptomyces sp. NPDC059786]
MLTGAHVALSVRLFAAAYQPTLNLWLGLGTAALCCSRRTSMYALLVSFLAFTPYVAHQFAGHGYRSLLATIIVGGSILLGIYGAGRWAAWVLRQRRTDAERAAADAIATERRLITRDLHDIVAHAVSLMLLQAAGATRILRTDPERAEVALGHVEELGEQAILELRRMLGLLSAEADRSATQRLPGCHDLHSLVERTRTDTFQVSLDTMGAPVPLYPGTDLCAYRIIQEALTNATRYADQHFPVRVMLAWHPAILEVRVSNRLSSARGPLACRLPTGRGLIGMRERAAAVGGSCQAGPQPDGTFRVTASFPLPRPASRPSEPAGRGRTVPSSITEQSL